ncbi:MAG: hypothetical protein U0236_10360 [Nitrospira sp.]
MVSGNTSTRVNSLTQHAILVVCGAALSILLCFILVTESRETPSTSYPVTIDSTSIVPESWWTIPGITPSIWGSDPESSDAYRTSKPRVLRLPPGRYKFINFTFDFPFEVTQEGTVDFASSLDQCVSGRGTNVLVVRCKRTYPYGGHPEYLFTP